MNGGPHYMTICDSVFVLIIFHGLTLLTLVPHNQSLISFIHFSLSPIVVPSAVEHIRVTGFSEESSLPRHASLELVWTAPQGTVPNSSLTIHNWSTWLDNTRTAALCVDYCRHRVACIIKT